MSNVGSVLKNEITRLARKEIRVQVEPLRKANANYRREIASLKRTIEELAKQTKQLSKSAARSEAPKAAAEEDGPKVRMTAKGIRSMRDRLGLSREAFGQLIGASGQSVFNWENGVKPRASTLVTMAELRGIGKKEAAARLEAMQGAPRPRGRKKSAA